MTTRHSINRIFAMVALCAAGLLAFNRAEAQLASLADVPLAEAPTSTVLPNLMYILDDSGSMAWNYMPDHIYIDSRGRLCGTWWCPRHQH